jgi:hypothetical protein
MMKYSSEDPVADVLLDFQSVMEQFLELQTEVIGAFTGRPPHGDTPPSGPGSVIDPVHQQPPAASAPVTAPDPPFVPEAVVDSASAPVTAIADINQFSRYTLSVRSRPLGHNHAGLAAGHAIVLTDDGR